MQKLEKCIFCNSQNNKTLKEVRELGHVFYLKKCNDCGLIYTDPQPSASEIGKFYGNDYYSYNELSQRNNSNMAGLKNKTRNVFYKKYYSDNPLNPAENLLFETFKNRYGPLPRRFKNPGKILDVGCGDGFFLLCLKKMGWETYGVEISEKATECSKKHDLDVFCGNIKSADYPDNFFDIIRFSHVLEHVHDPLATLEETHRVLKPGGQIIIKVPNCKSPAIKISAKSLQIPKHLFHFCPKTLSNITKQAGFADIKIKSYSVGIIQTSLPGFLKSQAFTPIFIIIDRFLDFLRLGDSITLTAGKSYA